MVAAAGTLRVASARFRWLAWLEPIAIFIYLTLATLSTVYHVYWDLYMDWGLLRKDAPTGRRWLRRHLMYPSAYIYYAAAVLNTVARVAWVLTISPDALGVTSDNPWRFITIIGFIELLRRSMWNFFRLENEQINNVGKFRVVNATAESGFDLAGLVHRATLTFGGLGPDAAAAKDPEAKGAVPPPPYTVTTPHGTQVAMPELGSAAQVTASGSNNSDTDSSDADDEAEEEEEGDEVSGEPEKTKATLMVRHASKLVELGALASAETE